MLVGLLVVYAQTSLIAVNNLVIAEAIGKKWIPNPGRRHLDKSLAWRRVKTSGLDAPETFRLEQKFDNVHLIDAPEIEGTDIVRVAGSRPKTPVLAPLSPTTRTYLDAVRYFVRAKGIANPTIHIDQLLSVDLDGDKSKEVLIVARARPEADPKTTNRNDYCVSLLRAKVGRAYKTFELAYYSNYQERNGPFRVQLMGFADYDGDGKFEFVHHARDPWSVDCFVYGYKQGRLVRLARTREGLLR